MSALNAFFDVLDGSEKIEYKLEGEVRIDYTYYIGDTRNGKCEGSIILSIEEDISFLTCTFYRDEKPNTKFEFYSDSDSQATEVSRKRVYFAIYFENIFRGSIKKGNKLDMVPTDHLVKDGGYFIYDKGPTSLRKVEGETFYVSKEAYSFLEEVYPYLCHAADSFIIYRGASISLKFVKNRENFYVSFFFRSGPHKHGFSFFDEKKYPDGKGIEFHFNSLYSYYRSFTDKRLAILSILHKAHKSCPYPVYEILCKSMITTTM